MNVIQSQSLNNGKVPLEQKSNGLFPLTGNLTAVEKECLHKLINLCMKHGKRNNSQKILLNTLRRISLLKSTPSNKIGGGFSLLLTAIDNVKPILEVRKVRISGITQLVPSIIPKNRQFGLAIRWIREAAIARRKLKKNLTLDQCFFAEVLDASQGIGSVKKKRDDLHKLAETNRGFAHYRWW